jgi:hypothetical protein
MPAKRRINPKTSLHRLPPHLEAYRRGQPKDRTSAPKKLPPLPLWAKLLSLLGMLVFWLALMGWLDLGRTGRSPMDAGFKLFCAAQVPLLWCWIRRQHRALTRRPSDEDEGAA